MNREQIMKAAERKKKPSFRKWWSKNGYKVGRVVLFPIWFYVIIRDKAKEKSYKELTYSDEMCNKYLDKVLPQIILSRGCTNEIVITNYDDGGDIEFSDLSWNLRTKNKKAKRFLSKFSTEVQEFILNEYQIEGYERVTATNWMEWQALKKRFDWKYSPCGDYTKGVVFFAK